VITPFATQNEMFIISMLKLSIITFSMNPQLLGVAFLKLPVLGLNGQDDRGRIGMLSQLQISTMYPSGSWKNTWSTLIPSSSTTAVTYLIPISCSFLLTRPTSVHYWKQNTIISTTTIMIAQFVFLSFEFTNLTWKDIWLSLGLIGRGSTMVSNSSIDGFSIKCMPMP